MCLGDREQAVLKEMCEVAIAALEDGWSWTVAAGRARKICREKAKSRDAKQLYYQMEINPKIVEARARHNSKVRAAYNTLGFVERYILAQEGGK